MVIFVDQSRNDGFSADRSQVGRVPDGLRFDVRGPLLPGLVRPVAVVMPHVLAEHPGKVAFADDKDPVQQLAPEAADEPFGDGVRPKVPGLEWSRCVCRRR